MPHDMSQVTEIGVQYSEKIDTFKTIRPLAPSFVRMEDRMTF